MLTSIQPELPAPPLPTTAQLSGEPPALCSAIFQFIKINPSFLSPTRPSYLYFVLTRQTGLSNYSCFTLHQVLDIQRRSELNKHHKAFCCLISVIIGVMNLIDISYSNMAKTIQRTAHRAIFIVPCKHNFSPNIFSFLNLLLIGSLKYRYLVVR